MTADSLACSTVTCLVISKFLLQFRSELCSFSKTNIIMSWCLYNFVLLLALCRHIILQHIYYNLLLKVWLVQKLHRLVPLWRLTVSDLTSISIAPFLKRNLWKLNHSSTNGLAMQHILRQKSWPCKMQKNAGAIAMFGEKYGEEVGIS